MKSILFVLVVEKSCICLGLHQRHLYLEDIIRIQTLIVEKL